MVKDVVLDIDRYEGLFCEAFDGITRERGGIVGAFGEA